MEPRSKVRCAVRALATSAAIVFVSWVAAAPTSSKAHVAWLVDGRESSRAAWTGDLGDLAAIDRRQADISVEPFPGGPDIAAPSVDGSVAAGHDLLDLFGNDLGSAGTSPRTRCGAVTDCGDLSGSIPLLEDGRVVDASPWPRLWIGLSLAVLCLAGIAVRLLRRSRRRLATTVRRCGAAG